MENKIVGNIVGVPNPRSDWEQNDPTKADFIKNKPSKVSQLQNDMDYATKKFVESLKLSQFEDDLRIKKFMEADFLFSGDAPSTEEYEATEQQVAELQRLIGVLGGNIPTKLSQLENDEDFAQRDALPTKLSQLTNDEGFITSKEMATTNNNIKVLQNQMGDVKGMYDTLMDAGYDAETIISAGESAFEACQIANENGERINSVESSVAEQGGLIGDLTDQVGDIETALDNIIAMQNTLIGGESE